MKKYNLGVVRDMLVTLLVSIIGIVVKYSSCKINIICMHVIFKPSLSDFPSNFVVASYWLAHLALNDLHFFIVHIVKIIHAAKEHISR